ncbi:MAG TPA: histidine kinase [Puia sp.]|nr:histidine kinase [Puia sp.]
MNSRDFIFSTRPSHRIIRHLVFWLVYCTYFYVQSLAPKQFDEFSSSDTYYFAFLNLCSFAPVFIFAVYFFIYFLLPRTLKRKKYGLFIFGFLMVYAVGTFINYFTALLFLRTVHYSIPIEPNFNNTVMFGNFNTRWGMIIATIALGIKLTKDWYLQQKENLEIVRKKTRAEMQLQKARIHPELLLRSLDAIYASSRSGSDTAPLMILNLSDVLSYSLYEIDKESVPLEKELLELHHLISLEQQNKERFIDLEVKIDGNVQNKHIAPMTIVKLLDDTITLLRNAERRSGLLTLNIISGSNDLSIRLTFTDSNENPAKSVKWTLLLENTRTRLSEFYSAANYQIEFAEQDQEAALNLKVKLNAAI